MNQDPSDESRPSSETAPGWQRSGRWAVWVGMILVGGLYLYSSRPVPAAFAWETDLAVGLRRAEETGRPILLEFHTRGCAACEWMDREVFSRSDVAAALADWIPIRVDGNHDRKAAAHYDIEAFPTFLTLGPDGTVITRRVGALPPQEFISLLQRAAVTRPAAGATTSPR